MRQKYASSSFGCARQLSLTLFCILSCIVPKCYDASSNTVLGIHCHIKAQLEFIRLCYLFLRWIAAQASARTITDLTKKSAWQIYTSLVNSGDCGLYYNRCPQVCYIWLHWKEVRVCSAEKWVYRAKVTLRGRHHEERLLYSQACLQIMEKRASYLIDCNTGTFCERPDYFDLDRVNDD